MKFSIAALAACVVPALAYDLHKHGDHKDFFEQEVVFEGGHRPDRPYPERPVPDRYERLTSEVVIKHLDFFADEADYIYEVVKVINCGNEFDRCWEPVRKALYKLEFELDLFDTKIDLSDLNKCWDCREEGKISLAYKNYAEALIRLLELIAYKTEYLDGETDKYIITAVNSLRAADYTFVYELVRRMRCEKYEKEIMKLQGATDGSTHDSIREAFALFVFTPYVKGDDFKSKKHH